MWDLVMPPSSLGGYSNAGTNILDMSLQKNVANQKITFVLIAAATDTGLGGQAGNIVAWIAKDGVQAAAGGTFTEILDGGGSGHAVYSYAWLQAETNANHVSMLVTCPNAIPFLMNFWTGGFHRNSSSPQQHVGFAMITISGLIDPTASPSGLVSKDSGTFSASTGAITNLGNGQFDFAPVASETDAVLPTYTFTGTNDIPQNIAIFTVTP